MRHAVREKREKQAKGIVLGGAGTPPATAGARIERLDRGMRWVLLALVLACYLIAPVVPLLLAVVLLAARAYACLKARDDPVHWSRLHNAFTYMRGW